MSSFQRLGRYMSNHGYLPPAEAGRQRERHRTLLGFDSYTAPTWRGTSAHFNTWEKRQFEQYDVRGADWVLNSLNSHAGNVQVADKKVTVYFFRRSTQICLKMTWLHEHGYTVQYTNPAAKRASGAIEDLANLPF